MQDFPRIAIGSTQQQADHRLVSWGVMTLLSGLGHDVQPYHSQSAFCPSAPTAAIGRDPRHLDPWQMGQSVCMDLMSANSRDCDVAVVEGNFAGPESENLHRLCDWLAIPRLGILDVSLAARCRDLTSLRGFAAVILDQVPDAEVAARWTVDVETVAGAKVVGWMPPRPALLNELHTLGEQPPSLDWCQVLSRSLAARCRVDKIWRIAQSAPPLPEPFRVARLENASTIALAFDEAFHQYFPDTLDRMEAAGCRIRTFSPLRDEALPPDADVVVIGCGPFAAHAQRLAENRCLHQSLAEHKRAGGRIYAEGSGAAFLCRGVELADGRLLGMSGLLPAHAIEVSGAVAAEPIETRWRSPLWLGSGSAPVRGYRNCGWEFASDQFDGELHPSCVIDTITDRNVIGTRVHVNFAAHASMLADFVQPLRSTACSNLA